MARVIAVSLEGVESTFGFASVDRSALYGRRRRVPLDEQGNQSAPKLAFDRWIKSGWETSCQTIWTS